MEAERGCEKTVEMFKNIEAVIDNDWLKQKGLETFEFMKQIQNEVKSITLKNKELVINCSAAQFDNISKLYCTGISTESVGYHVSEQLPVEFKLDENIWEYMAKIYAQEIKRKTEENGVQISTFEYEPLIKTVVIVPENKIGSNSSGCMHMKKFILDLHDLLESSIEENIERLGVRIKDEEAVLVMETIKDRFGDVLIKRDSDGQFIVVGPPTSCHQARQKIRSMVMRQKAQETRRADANVSKMLCPQMINEPLALPVGAMNWRHRSVDDEIEQKAGNVYKIELPRKIKSIHDGSERKRSLNYERKIADVEPSNKHSVFQGVFNNTNVELVEDDVVEKKNYERAVWNSSEGEDNSRYFISDKITLNTHSNDNIARDDDDDDGDEKTIDSLSDPDDDGPLPPPDTESDDDVVNDGNNYDNKDVGAKIPEIEVLRGFNVSMPRLRKETEELTIDTEERHNSVLKSGSTGSSGRKKLPDL